jgi:hypothetical protein
MLGLAVAVVGASGTHDLRRVLFMIAIASAGGSLGAATISEFLIAAQIVPTRRPFNAPRPSAPPYIKNPRKPKSNRGHRGSVEQIAYLVRRAAIGLAVQCARLARLVLRILWRAGNAVVYATKRAWHAAVTAVLVLAGAAQQAVATLARASGAVAQVAWIWIRWTVLGLALVAGAAVAAVAGSSEFTSYLAGHGLIHGAISIVLAVATAATLVAAWGPLTRREWGDVKAAAQRLIERAAAPLFITLVALGWADGVLGLLGIGSIRPGWLTISGTVALAASVAYAWHTSQDVTDHPQPIG